MTNQVANMFSYVRWPSIISTPEVTQTSEMDICLWFWNEEYNQVEDRYWDSKILGHTTHQHLLDPVHEGFRIFDMAKIVQVLLDGPNVNLKYLEKLKEQTNKLGSPGLIDLGSCNLHIVYAAFKFSAEASGGNFKKLLKWCFQLLKDSSARWDNFFSVT